MSYPNDQMIGGAAGQPLGATPTVPGLSPEIMQMLMLMAQAMSERQQTGAPSPAGLFGGQSPQPLGAPPTAGPTPGPIPPAPTAGVGALTPPMPGTAQGIGIPDAGTGGGFADFNRRNGLT